jgi:hypothetical protein
MGRFALQASGGRPNSSLEMWGAGRSNVSQWQAEDGYVFLQGKPDQVLTIVDRDSNPRPFLASRGGAYQSWYFIPFK